MFDDEQIASLTKGEAVGLTTAKVKELLKRLGVVFVRTKSHRLVDLLMEYKEGVYLKKAILSKSKEWLRGFTKKRLSELAAEMQICPGVARKDRLVDLIYSLGGPSSRVVVTIGPKEEIVR